MKISDIENPCHCGVGGCTGFTSSIWSENWGYRYVIKPCKLLDLLQAVDDSLAYNSVEIRAAP